MEYANIELNKLYQGYVDNSKATLKTILQEYENKRIIRLIDKILADTRQARIEEIRCKQLG